MANHVTDIVHAQAPGITPYIQSLDHKEDTDTGFGETDMNETKKEGMHL